MNVNRITRYFKGVPRTKNLIEIITFPQSMNVYTDSDWEGQSMTCKTHKRCSFAVGERNAFWMEAELFVLTTGIAEGMGTKHLSKEGNEVTLVNHVDSHCAKAWASKQGLGLMRCRGEEANDMHISITSGTKQTG